MWYWVVLYQACPAAVVLRSAVVGSPFAFTAQSQQNRGGGTQRSETKSSCKWCCFLVKEDSNLDDSYAELRHAVGKGWRNEKRKKSRNETARSACRWIWKFVLFLRRSRVDCHLCSMQPWEVRHLLPSIIFYLTTTAQTTQYLQLKDYEFIQRQETWQLWCQWQDRRG